MSAPPCAASPPSMPRNMIEWVEEPRFIEDVMRFLDNVLEDFIDSAPPAEMSKAVYSAKRERSVGLGLDGLPFLPATARHSRLKAPWPNHGTTVCSSISAWVRTQHR